MNIVKNSVFDRNHCNSMKNCSINEVNDHLIEDCDHRSDTFNPFFAIQVVNLANAVHKPLNYFFTETSLIMSCKKSFFLQPIIFEKVLHYINEMSPSKSTKSDCPPFKYIKLANNVHVIAPCSTELFNQ